MSEEQWWMKELESIFVAPVGTPISSDMKRAANIALKIARGERWDEEKQEWTLPPAPQGVTEPTGA